MGYVPASERIASALLNLHLDPADAESWVSAVQYARTSRHPHQKTIEAARKAVRERISEKVDPVILGSLKVRRR